MGRWSGESESGSGVVYHGERIHDVEITYLRLSRSSLPRNAGSGKLEPIIMGEFSAREGLRK